MSEFQRKGAKAQRKKLLILCALWLFSNERIFAQVANETQALNAIKLATNPTSKLAAAEDFIARFESDNVLADCLDPAREIHSADAVLW